MVDTAISIEINGRDETVLVNATTSLHALLHERLDLHSVRSGCSVGTCGSCAVLLDGELVLSCLVPALRVEGHRIETLEGLSHANEIESIQAAFIECGATQCGYCTAGMIIAAKQLLDDNPAPTREAILEAISGNVCRCTGYEPIVAAIALAAHGQTDLEK